jgi:RimJ/RimL family protein N-acetyltransferase
MTKHPSQPTPGELLLREVAMDDLPIFFEHQRDADAARMTAFTATRDWDAFMAHWARIMRDPAITIRTIVFDRQVAGNVLCYVDEAFGKPEVAYWIGREFWGKGVATRALAAFLGQVTVRPVYGRVARDNLASLRVLEKCGFTICGEEREFAAARNEEVDALILELGRSEH